MPVRRVNDLIRRRDYLVPHLDGDLVAVALEVDAHAEDDALLGRHQTALAPADDPAAPDEDGDEVRRHPPQLLRGTRRRRAIIDVREADDSCMGPSHANGPSRGRSEHARARHEGVSPSAQASPEGVLELLKYPARLRDAERQGVPLQVPAAPAEAAEVGGAGGELQCPVCRVKVRGDQVPTRLPYIAHSPERLHLEHPWRDGLVGGAAVMA